MSGQKCEVCGMDLKYHGPTCTTGGSFARTACSVCRAPGEYMRTRHLETCDVDVFICNNAACADYGLYFYGPERKRPSPNDEAHVRREPPRT